MTWAFDVPEPSWIGDDGEDEEEYTYDDYLSDRSDYYWKREKEENENFDY